GGTGPEWRRVGLAVPPDHCRGGRRGFRSLGNAPVRDGSQRTPQGSCGGVAMNEPLTAEGYEQTKDKLRDLETRLAEIEKRTDLDPKRLASVRRSYKMMMREFLQDIKLYEAKQNPVAHQDQR